MGVINNLLGRLKLYADPSVTTQTTTVVQSNTTNSNLALVPNGTGAIVASIPDGTATGGNARGNYVVDLQRVRTAANQINVSPYGVLLNGQNNKTNGSNYETIINGINNYINCPYGIILNGSGNTIQWTPFGSNTVINGVNNYASAQGSISSGNGSSASSNYAVAIGNGANASGASSFAHGDANTSSGDYSVSFGFQNTASGIGSMVSGYRGLAYLQSQRTIGNTSQGWGSPYYGLSQASEIVASRLIALSTGGTATLSLDSTGTTNLIIPTGNNRAWNVQINTIAIISAITGTATGVSVGDTYSEVKNLLFKKVSGTSSIVGTVDTSNVKSDTSMSTCALTVTAGASQEMALTFTAPTFTGGGTVTCRVVSKVMLTEVAY